MKKVSFETKNILYFSFCAIILTFFVGWIGYSIFENRYPSIFEIWNRWDTKMYLRIAEIGYPFTDEGRFLITVLPFYPYLIRFTSFLLRDNLASALFISNLCFITSLIYLYKLIRLDFPQKVAWRSILYLSIFPTAYFLHSGYSESLFLMLVIISIYLARKGKWFMASSFGMLAVLSRITGIIILPFLLAEYLQSKKFDYHKVKSDILWLGLLPLGSLLYLLINYKIFGNPFEFLTSLRVFFWEQPSLPWHGIIRAFSRFSLLQPADWMIEGAMVILFWIFGIIMLFASIRKVRFSYNVFSWLSFLFVSSTTTLSSLPRFLLMFFPFFIVLALWGKNQTKHFFITFVSISLQCIFLILFVREHWAF